MFELELGVWSEVIQSLWVVIKKETKQATRNQSRTFKKATANYTQQANRKQQTVQRNNRPTHNQDQEKKTDPERKPREEDGRE